MASSTIRAFASKAKTFLDIPINWGKSPAQNNPEVNKAVTKVLEDAAEILVDKAPDGMTANVKGDVHGEGTAKKSHLTVSIRKAVTGSHLVSGHVYPNGTVGWSQEWMKWEWSQKLKKEAEKAKAEGGEGSGEAAEIAKDEKK